MFSFLRPHRSGNRPSASSDVPDPTAGLHKAVAYSPIVAPTEWDAPRYPPDDRGIPAEDSEAVFARQEALVARIFRTSGVSPEDFSVRYRPILVNLARYIHLLPATDTEYFVGPGGLLSLSLEVGLHALQSAHSSEFPTVRAADKRHVMIPRWSLATLVAGLCSQLYRPISMMSVFDRDNRHWPSLIQPITDWLAVVEADRYFIRWHPRPTAGSPPYQAASAFLVSNIVPREVLQYLSEENDAILPAMLAAIAGDSVGRNPIALCVAPTVNRVVSQDRAQNSRHYGNYSLGVHIEPHLIDAMRRLVKGGTWAINAKGSRLWIGAEGSFLVWGTAARDVTSLMLHDNFVGIPQDPDTLADVLCESGVLQRHVAGSSYWAIVLPDTGTIIDNAVKLRERSLILPTETAVEQFDSIKLLVPEDKSAAVDSDPQQSRRPAMSPRRKAVSPSPDTSPDLFSTPRAREIAVESAPRSAAPSAQSPVEAPTARHEPGNTEASPSASNLLDSLSKDTQGLLRMILDAQKTGTLTGVLKSFDYGFGISNDELACHGIRVADAITELRTRNWLWVDLTRPSRKMVPVEVDGKSLTFLVLRPEIARSIGFPHEPPAEV